jgi:DNA-directed RNA polymerase subunit RPC12/RpoP
MKTMEELKKRDFYRCNECKCAIGYDWFYKDFSGKNIIVCPQCKSEIYPDDKPIYDR